MKTSPRNIDGNTAHLFGSIDRKRLQTLAVLSYLILISVSFATTSTPMRQLIEVIRILAAGSLIITSAMLFLRSRYVSRVFVYGVFLYLLVVAYGLLLAIIFGGLDMVATRLPMNFVITLIGLYLFLGRRQIIELKTVRHFLIYVGLVFFATVMFGGFSFSYPPHFIFEYQSTSHGTSILYSQGVSKFFGLAAVLAIYSAFQFSKVRWRIAFIILSAALIMLSLLGGARGDGIIAVLLVFSFILLKSPKYTVILVFSAIIFWNSFSEYLNADNFMIIARIMALENNFGQRDILFQQAVILLADNPGCLLTGCGFGYFQTYFGYEPGLYPHNIALEALITWGLPITFFLIYLVARGLRKALRENMGNMDAFMLVFFYFVLISFKSGTILSEWVVLVGVFKYAALAFLEEGNTRSFITHKQVRA